MYWLAIFYSIQDIWKNMETMEGLISNFGWTMVKITNRVRQKPPTRNVSIQGWEDWVHSGHPRSFWPWDYAGKDIHRVTVPKKRCGISLKLQAFVVLLDISKPQTKFSDSNSAKPGSWSIPNLAPLLLADLIKLQPLVLLEPQSCLGKVSGSPDQRWSNSTWRLKLLVKYFRIVLLSTFKNSNFQSTQEHIQNTVNALQYSTLFLDWIYHMLSFV